VASDGNGSASEDLAFTILDRLIVSPVSPRAAHINAPYSLDFQAFGAIDITGQKSVTKIDLSFLKQFAKLRISASAVEFNLRKICTQNINKMFRQRPKFIPMLTIDRYFHCYISTQKRKEKMY